MNDRPTASTITDAQLDELYDEIARQARLRSRIQAAADEARGSMRDWLVDALADSADPREPSTARTFREQAAHAEAALARVRKACDSVRAADQGHNPAVDWVVMRVLEAVDARLVSGGLPPVPPGPAVPCPACARADQAGLAPAEQHPTCASKEQLGA